MEHNVHGGDLFETSRKYGVREEDIIDFSSNINPLGISLKLKQILHEKIDNLDQYPDPECNELRNELSLYTGINKNNIIVGNGASEIIKLILEVLRPSRILLPAPCFAEYERGALLAGSQIEYYELSEKNDFKLDMVDLMKHVTDDIETILICNPNNPTSVLIPAPELVELVEYARGRGVNVIVDEAFIELTIGGRRNSIAGYTVQYSNLFVIGALTKILAIPGLRLGYAMGNQTLIGEMWKRKTPWSVNLLACSIGKALDDPQYFADTADWLKQEKEWLFNELTRLGKYTVFKPDTNFILMKIEDDKMDSSTLKHMLVEKGILIRDAENFKFLGNRFIRVAIKDRKNNERLVMALKSL